MEFETKEVVVDCKTCGERFTTVEIAGIKLPHCDACAEAYARRLEEKTRHRSAPVDTKTCVPEGYQDFELSKLPEASRDLATSSIFTWRFSPVGVGIGGRSNLGKSYIMFELARRWQEHGKRVVVVQDQHIGRMVRENSPERDRLLAQIQRAEILVWDDFGLTKMTDAVAGTYNDILETVNRRNIPIFGTCNYGGQDLKRIWAKQMGEQTFLEDRGERIVRRFRDRCELKIVK